MTTIGEAAWAAGLFEGEGAITTCRGRRRIGVKMVEELSVRRFAAIVGVGKVYGPYKNRSDKLDGSPRRDFFYWLAEEENAVAAMEVIGPWLSPWRYDRFAALFPKHVKTSAE